MMVVENENNVWMLSTTWIELVREEKEKGIEKIVTICFMLVGCIYMNVAFQESIFYVFSLKMKWYDESGWSWSEEGSGKRKKVVYLWCLSCRLNISRLLSIFLSHSLNFFFFSSYLFREVFISNIFFFRFFNFSHLYFVQESYKNQDEYSIENLYKYFVISKKLSSLHTKRRWINISSYKIWCGVLTVAVMVVNNCENQMNELKISLRRC